LELYALHKQAVSGDAPTTIPPSTAVGERAKYQAWQRRMGMAPEQAMLLYVQECDRQLRTYGSVEPPTPQSNNNNNNSINNNNNINSNNMNNINNSINNNNSNINNINNSINNNNSNINNNNTNINNNNTTTTTDNDPPRGIIAIPLLCAAAAESRTAYVRRMSHTSTGWWARQEPLCAHPGTLLALPELGLLKAAAIVEYLSLQGALMQSFLWPTHNVCLALWMAVILVFTMISSACTLLSTVLRGSQQTGMTLPAVWSHDITPTASAVHTLCEEHQPLTVRLVGLFLLPFPTMLEYTERGRGVLTKSLLYIATVLCVTWWYWSLVVPWLCACMLGTALVSGACFAIIGLAAGS
jgi:acyl-CoA-binding protein